MCCVYYFPSFSLAMSSLDTYWERYLKNYDLDFMVAIFNAVNFDPSSPSWFLGKTSLADARYLTPEYRTIKTPADGNLPVNIDAMRAFIETGKRITLTDLKDKPDLLSGFMFSTVSNYQMTSLLLEWSNEKGYNLPDLIAIPKNWRAQIVHGLWFKDRVEVDEMLVNKDPLVTLIRERTVHPNGTPGDELYCGVFQDIYAEVMRPQPESEDPPELRGPETEEEKIFAKIRTGFGYDLAAFDLFVKVFTEIQRP